MTLRRVSASSAWALALALALVPTSTRSEAELRLETSGCAALRADRTCELDPRRRALRVWVQAAEPSAIEVRVDGAPVRVTPKPVAAGTLLGFQLPKAARALRVSVRDGERSASASVALAERQTHPLLDQLEQRRQSSADVRDETPASELRPLPGALRARALDLVARRELARGRTPEALSLLSEAERLHQEHGSISGEVRDAFAIAYAKTMLTRDFAGAEHALARARRRVEDYPDGRADLAYYEGILASETGEYRAAHAALLDAEARSLKLGRDDQVALVQRTSALLLTNLGRFEEAHAVLTRAKRSLAQDAAACQRAHVLTNVGWVALRSAQRRAERGEAQAEPGSAVANLATEADESLRQAIALYRGDCPNPAYLDNARINLADLSLFRGDRGGAREQLEARSPLATDVRGAVSWEDIQGRMALADGAPARALAHFDREAELAASAVLPGAAWRASLGRAQALEALGHTSAALKRYSDSEALLDQQAAALPFAPGRESFLAEHASGARLLVELLLRMNEPKQAFEVARRARVRALSALRWTERAAALAAGERERWQAALGDYARRRAELDTLAARDWQLSSERLAQVRAERASAQRELESALGRALGSLGVRAALPAPIPVGELALLVFPLRRGHVVFAADSGSVHTHVLEAWPGVSELGQALFQPLKSRLDSARYLRVLAFGMLKSIDVHALTVDGAPLGHRLPVVYGVDALVEAPVRSNAASALIVADTTGNLRSARLEAQRVAQHLQRFGPAPRILNGDEATSARVLAGLGAVRLFHFAGHARHADGGWASALSLASGAELTVTDILALGRAPELVVLAGCETGRSETQIDVESIGLSQAFVLAGARYVVAASRRPPDDDARRVVEAFYAQAQALENVPRALSQAGALLARREPALDWASFRVVVP